jgi:hypothetical protein
MPLIDGVHPFVADATSQQTDAILGAMRAVAETGSPLSANDRRALAAAARYMFGRTQSDDAGAMAPVSPDALAATVANPELRENALKFLTVMAFVDGKLDTGKIAAVIRYANALGIHARYVDEIADAAQGHVHEALADMTRANMESIAGRPVADANPDETKWLLPYDTAPDPALAARFDALAALPKETFGHAFYAHFRDNNYAFPGRKTALNSGFSLPHDSAHVVSGYNTTPRGELLVSTFTAGMHPQFPMAGHILPVIFSWQLGVQINPVAKDASGTLDPREFWHAYAGGKTATVDTFAPAWDFWRYVETPLRDLRRQWAIPEDGLETGPG